MKDGNREESGEKRCRGKAKRRGRRKGEKGGRTRGPQTSSYRIVKIRCADGCQQKREISTGDNGQQPCGGPGPQH